MAIGRKRKSEQRKQIEGTARKDRSNPSAPRPDASPLVPPESLTGAEREWFGVLSDRLVVEKRASASHTEVVAMLARRLGEIDACSTTIAAEGMTYETTNEKGQRMVRPHPAVAQRSEALRHAQSLLAEIGLTPASVTKVSVPQAPPAGNAFVRLMV